jgi:Cupredoxin-like domain
MNTEDRRAAATQEWPLTREQYRRSRRRRPPYGRWALGVLALAAVGGVMFQFGQAVDEKRSAGAQPAPTYPAEAAATAPVTTTPPAPPTTAPPRPHVLSLVTRNIGTAQNPDRVYLQPGKVDAAQAARGAHPRYVVRRRELLRIRVDNQDQFIHSFTFAKARVNLDAWEGTVSAATFKAPTTPGTYQFYCRYRKIGMSGTLVVR